MPHKNIDSGKEEQQRKKYRILKITTFKKETLKKEA